MTRGPDFMADPVFPGRVRTSKVGVEPITHARFTRKLHENEKNSSGAYTSLVPTLDPLMQTTFHKMKNHAIRCTSCTIKCKQLPTSLTSICLSFFTCNISSGSRIIHTLDFGAKTLFARFSPKIA